MKRVTTISASTAISSKVISKIQEWVDTSYEDFVDHITDYAEYEGLTINEDLIEQIAADYANKTVAAALEEGVSFSGQDLWFGLAEYADTFNYHEKAEHEYKNSIV